jgi:hypothetical protein
MVRFARFVLSNVKNFDPADYPEFTGPLFPSLFDVYSDAITCESVEPVTPVLDPGSQSMSPASVRNLSTSTEVNFESSTHRQLPKQIGQYLTESDIVTDSEDVSDAILPLSRSPMPRSNSKQVPKNTNQQFAFKNPNLKREFHPSINGECL